MITKLKEITFTFENCDYITIDGKYIGDIFVEDIRTSIKRVACNCIEKYETTYGFAVEIHQDANQDRYEFDQTHIEEFKQKIFKRFVCCDITNVEIILEEDYVEKGKMPKTEKYSYYVHWTGDSDNYNESQIHYISKCGHLYLVIANGKSIEDFFDIDDINDGDYMDFKFDMYDVGDI